MGYRGAVNIVRRLVGELLCVCLLLGTGIGSLRVYGVSGVDLINSDTSRIVFAEENMLLDEWALAQLNELGVACVKQSGVPLRVLLAEDIQDLDAATDLLGEVCDYYSGVTMVADPASNLVMLNFYADHPGLTPEVQENIQEEMETSLALGEYEKMCEWFLTETTRALSGEEDGAGDSASEDLLADWQMIYDHHQLFSEDEKAELSQRMQELYRELQIPFVILSDEVAESTELVDYSKAFFLDNLQTDLPDAVLLTFDTPHRRFRIDSHGRFRYILTDDDAAAIVEQMFPYMREDDFVGAAELFLEEAAADIRTEQGAEEEVIWQMLREEDVPVPEPSLRVYDYTGTLEEGELDNLRETAADYSAQAGVEIILALCNGYGEESLPVYTQFFLNNYLGAGGAPDGVVAVLDVGMERCCIVSEGSANLIGGEEVTYMDEYFFEQEGVLDNGFSCLNAIFDKIELQQMINRLEIPAPEEGVGIYDEAGLLTDEERASLQAMIDDYESELGYRFLAYTVELEDERLLEPYRQMAEAINDDIAAVLVIDSVSEGATLRLGWSVVQKMDSAFDYRVLSAARDLIAEGRHADACAEVFKQTRRGYKTIIPYALIDYAPGILYYSFTAATCISIFIMLILLLVHRGIKTKAPKTREYQASQSLQLNYKSDVFLYSHVSQTRRSRDNDSSSSGGSVSSGGSSVSSGAEGRY